MSKTNMRTGKTENKRRLWVSVLCIVLCALLAGGTITSVLLMILA